ncbi:hypothetical protein PHJA_002118900 [Phtheirospermum japonicum]|uniref:Uncharacterized protein n=1 Tax=Phtheirospermum japonicum TaxID=374723 RepID=A0A830CQB0_9LAMI|nr:hypothetical protein PHJA_002118900 [Phtheirospermum japonicum]
MMRARVPQPRRRVTRRYRKNWYARRRRGSADQLPRAILMELESFLILRIWSRYLYAMLKEQIDKFRFYF